MLTAALTSQQSVSDPLFWHRLQFAFTITFHYLFPQLTMGLALIVLLFRLRAFRGDAQAGAAARFWTKVLGVNFLVGVVTGIPMEFQFGTNWARFSHYAGGVIGQTLAMESTFAFFLESAFLGLVLYGEKKLGRVGHLAATAALFLGSWLSGYFIIATNAFMQHPVGYTTSQDGVLPPLLCWCWSPVVASGVRLHLRCSEPQSLRERRHQQLRRPRSRNDGEPGKEGHEGGSPLPAHREPR